MTAGELEKFCVGLPGTRQDVKWGNDLCYLVAEKMCCVTPLEGRLTASFKVLAEEMHELTERNGIIPAPYMARNNSVFVDRAAALSVKEWKYYIRQSYDLVVARLPKKARQKLK